MYELAHDFLFLTQQSTADIYGVPRESLADENPMEKADQLLNSVIGKTTSRSQASSSVYLPDCGQVVRALSSWKVPDGVLPKG